MVSVGLAAVFWAATGGNTAALPAVAILVALGVFVAVAMRYSARQHERIWLDAEGIHDGTASASWEALTIAATERELRFTVGARRVLLEATQVANWRDVVGAARARVAPTGWRITSKRAAAARRRGLPTRTLDEPSSYREGAPRTPSTELPPWWRVEPRRRRRLALLGAAALFVGVTLTSTHRGVVPARGQIGRTPARELVSEVVLGGPPPSEIAVHLLGIAAALVGSLGVAIGFGGWRLGRDEAIARAWVGSSVRSDGQDAVASLDGRHRAWIEPESPLVPMGAWMQRTDAREVVIASRFGRAAFTQRPEARTHFRCVAMLPHAIDSGRHFQVQRDALGRSRIVPFGAARVLVLDSRDDGFVLHRFTAERAHAGSTWHRTRLEAEAQIADEYGQTVSGLREIPIEPGPIAFFAHVELA